MLFDVPFQTLTRRQQATREAEMPYRMRPAKPVVHEALPIHGDGVPEAKYGWYDLTELAEIAGVPGYLLLERFLDFGIDSMRIRGEKMKFFYFMATPCHGLERFEIFSLNIRDRNDDCMKCRCWGRMKEMRLGRYAENHRVYVSAGWGVKVLAEIQKNLVPAPVA